MIKSIKLNNCTPYLQSELSDCKEVNYIYGANGSGKSTLSSFLSGVNETRFSESTIEWVGENHEKIEVYNKAFRLSNLQQEMKGVFTLGSASIDEINNLEKLKTDLEKQKQEWENYCKAFQEKEKEREKIENKFKEDVWEQILKRNASDFSEAFEGFRKSKEKLVFELKRRVEKETQEGKACKREDLLKRAQILYASNPKTYERYALDIDECLRKIEDIRKDRIWETVIVGSKDVDIAALIDELDNSSWVRQGRQYLRADLKTCPFCQKETITEDFRQKLEIFFDEEYELKIEHMCALQKEYCTSAVQIINSIQTLIQNKGELPQIGQLKLDVLLAKKDLLEVTYKTNESEISKKIREPEKKVLIVNESNVINEIKDLIDSANIQIDKHNALVDKRQYEKKTLSNDVWATCIQESSDLIKRYQRDISNVEKGRDGLKKCCDLTKSKVDKLQFEIEEKGKNITSVKPTIDEINRSLKAYGFTNFSICPAENRENYYCIKRDDGTLASNTLSEGEETFLTFLYFMQKVKGSTDKNSVSDKKIIVLDDPISSLDSTILYIVGAIVKDLSKKIIKKECDVTQLFVLTHNVFFHKEASFINGKHKEKKNVNYWIIRKNKGVSEIKAYGTTNPISTSYELLWQELRDNTEASLISTQNTMRRIIENYFGMLGEKCDEVLVNHFESIEDKMIAKSLLYWINDGSHSIPDDLYIDSYTDAVPRYKDVFRELFEKSGHLSHYNMMMGNQADAGLQSFC